MASIGKIKLGNRDKREFFDMSHDVNTTCGFGFAEPTMFLDLIPKAKVSLQANTGVRLAPLPQPTTGLINVRHYYSFVPTQEVFEAFENLQSQTTVRTSRGSYIPEYSDTIENHRLFLMLLSICNRKFHDALSQTPNFNSRDFSSQWFQLSIHSNYDLWSGDSVEVHNLFDDVKKWTTSGWTQSNEAPYKCLAAFYQTLQHMIPVINSRLCQYFSENLGATNFSAQRLALDPTMFTEEMDIFKSENTTLTPALYRDYFRMIQRLPEAFKYVWNQARSIENADYLLEIPLTAFDGNTPALYRADNTEWGQLVDLTGKKCYVGIHLTPAGKRLFKIFNAMRVNFGYRTDVELPKLFAYYKGWFDIFNPGRNIQWKDTSCYEIIHSFYDSPSFNCSKVFTDLFFSDNALTDFDNAYVNFFIDLCECFYTQKVDPITVATDKPVLEVGASTADQITLFNNDTNSVENFGYGYGENHDDFGGLSIRFLDTFYRLVNKNSVIGQRVALYMKEHFGIDAPHTTFIDKHSFDINVVDAIGTVNNEETALGEYAGIGKGQNAFKPIHFEASRHGYLIQYTIVVPRCGYVQAGMLAKKNRLDWFQPEYDSLGMEPVSQYEVNSRNSVIDTFNSDNPTFGFRPRYFGQKYLLNLANGGFSFRSDRGNFLGYSLDRLFSEPDYFNNELMRLGDYGEAGRVAGSLVKYDGVTLAPDESLRYIGIDESFGNFNRIFYDTTGFTDNFIVFIHNDVKMHAPMKSISDSFETFDEETDTDVINVEHS